MKNLTLLLVLFFSLACTAQTYTVTMNDKKNGFEALLNDETGALDLVKVEKNGKYYILNTDNSLAYIAHIKDNAYDGQFEYYTKSRLDYKGQFEKGIKAGVWKYYLDNKLVRMEILYRQDSVFYSSYVRDALDEIVCTETQTAVIAKNGDIKGFREKKCAPQPDMKHVEVVNKINDKIPNKWNFVFFQPGEFYFGMNTITFSGSQKGGESGDIAIRLIDKKYRQKLNSYVSENANSSMAYKILETKSYLVCLEFTDVAASAKKEIQKEIVKFFEETKESL